MQNLQTRSKIFSKTDEGERLDEIGFGGLKLFQRPEEFCYGVDAVLLADFAAREANFTSAADLGTGTGVIPLILSHKTDAKLLFGVEIQESSCRCAEKSVQLNGLEDRIKIIHQDVSVKSEVRDKIAEIMKCPAAGSEGEAFVDAVTCNPPYTEGGGGLKNREDAKMIARHEVAASLEDFFAAAEILLRPKGHLFMVHRPARLVDIFTLARKYALEPKKMRLVCPRKNAAPNMVLLHFIKQGGRQLDVMEDLFIREEDGSYSPEIEKIYER